MNVYMMIATAPISDTAKAKLMLVASSHSAMIEAAYQADSPGLLEQLATQLPDVQAGQNVTVSGGSHVVVNFGKMVQRDSGRSSGGSKSSSRKASTAKVSGPAEADGDKTLVRDTWIKNVFAPLLQASQSCQVADSFDNARVVSNFSKAVKNLNLRSPLKMALFYPAGTSFEVLDGYKSVSTTRLKNVTTPEGFWVFKQIVYRKAVKVGLIETEVSEPEVSPEVGSNPPPEINPDSASDTVSDDAPDSETTSGDDIHIDLGDLWNNS